MSYSCLFHHGQYQSAPAPVPGEPDAGVNYASIDTMDDGAVARYQGAAVVDASIVSPTTTRSSPTSPTRIACRTIDFGAALAGSTNSQIFNRHADWGPCISDTRHNFNAVVGGRKLLEDGQRHGPTVC